MLIEGLHDSYIPLSSDNRVRAGIGHGFLVLYTKKACKWEMAAFLCPQEVDWIRYALDMTPKDHLRVNSSFVTCMMHGNVLKFRNEFDKKVVLLLTPEEAETLKSLIAKHDEN